MSLYAVDAIDDALSATRSFLWPFDRGRWLRLALVVFFALAIDSAIAGAIGGLLAD